ncbi:hypothetical protein [Gillisia sp. CAL575]|uniref:hypothetical protein n=1 Tax=Gillisia sp. CAL575 TaxID=985255 RepID=UPI0003A89B34|nr:hypothetical protein [Gillisia sp. CAL575]
MIKHFLKLFVVLLSLGLVTSCDYDDEIANPEYVSLQFSPTAGENVGVEVGGSTNYDVKVYSANIKNEDRTFNVVVLPTTTLGASGYTVPGTVTIPGGTNEGTLSISVSDVGLGVAGKSLFLGLEADPSFTAGSPVRLNVARVCPGKEFVVNLTLDAYPSETGWELIDSDGVTVLKVTTATATRSLCIASGTYTFILTDSYGDGIADGGATLTYAGEVLATLSGDFGTETSVEVTF